MVQPSPPRPPRTSGASAARSRSSPQALDSSPLREPPRQSYSPLSDMDEEAEDTVPPAAPLSDSGSSSLSEIEDIESQDTAGSVARSASEAISDEDQASDAQEPESDNETEAETERLEISPQKGRMSLMVHDSARAHAISEPSNLSATTRPDLAPQDLDEQSDSSESEADDVQDARNTSPASLSGRKRKRVGEVSPASGRLSVDAPPPKKRSSMRMLTEIPKAGLAYADGALDMESALSSNEDDEEVDAVEEDVVRPPMSPPTPEAVRVQGPLPEDVDMDDVVEAEENEEVEDNDDDEAEATAKTEDELARKKVAYDSFTPIEKLFAIFRDKVFNERWTELTAELEMLNDPETTHPDFLAQRLACDQRRDEIYRREGVMLKYKQEAMAKKMLANRAILFAQSAQRIRTIREEMLATLNTEFCQIQRERRQFKGADSHFTIPFETDRIKQVENQAKYNKEVSLLSGIARHKGFPAAPELKAARRDEADADFAAMRISTTVTNGRPFSYTTQLAHSNRADEMAAEQNFLEQTPWANPNHPALQKTRFVENAPRAATAAPSTATQPWMMSGGLSKAASLDPRSSMPPLHEVTRAPPQTKASTPSHYDQARRNEVSWAGNGYGTTSGISSAGKPARIMTPLQAYLQDNGPIAYKALALAPPAGHYGTPMAQTPDREREIGDEDRGRAREKYPPSTTSQTPRDGLFGDVASVGVR